MHRDVWRRSRFVYGLCQGSTSRFGCSSTLPRAALGVEAGLELAGWGELKFLRGCDLHGLTCARVAPLASTAIGHLELAEAEERDLLAFESSAGDHFEHGVDELTGIALGELVLLGQTLHQIVPVHNLPPC